MKLPRTSFTLLFAVLAFAGCALMRDYYFLGPNPDNPFSGIRRVAVIPFADQTKSRIDPVETAALFASECASFAGFDVIYPAQVQETLTANGWKIESPEDAVKLGRALEVDGVFFATIHEHDPYDPPTAGLTLYLFATSPTRRFSRIWEASDRGAPVMPGAQGNHAVVAMVQRVYSARTVDVEKKLKGWARRQSRETDLGWEHFKRVNREYMRFCYNLMLRDLCALGKRAEDSSAKARRPQETRR